MGLDQYLFVHWIPQKFFEESKNYGEVLDLVVDGFHGYDPWLPERTVYFRKGWTLDRFLIEMSTWHDEYSNNLFIPSENVEKICMECVRVIQSLPEFSGLAVPQFFEMYPSADTFISAIRKFYPTDSEREAELYNKTADIGLDDGYSDPCWDLRYYYDLLKMIHNLYQKDVKNFNLFYVRYY